MAFLSPWFFLGLLAVAGPLIAHLRRRSVRNRVYFSAVDFLEAQSPKATRNRWEHVGLLLLRILSLALIIFAFTRPYLRESVSGDTRPEAAKRHVIVLLDRSASMRREGAFSRALIKVRELVSSLSEEDELEIITFDHKPHSVLKRETWSQTASDERVTLVESVMKALRPTWNHARLDEALRYSVECHSGLPEITQKEVIVISDFQEGTGVSGLQGYEWPKGLSVSLVRIASEAAGKDESALFLHWLHPDWTEGSAEAPFRLQLSPGHGFKSERVKLRMESAAPLEWVAPVGRDRMTTLSVPSPPVQEAYIRLDGSEDYWGGVWVARVPERKILVSINGSKDSSQRTGSSYFMERALAAIGSSRVEVAAAKNLSPERDSEVSLWVLSGVVDREWIRRMRSGMEAGATGLFIIEDVSDCQVLSALTGENVRGTEANVDGFAALGETSWAHPIFSAFSTPQFADFSALHFWRYRQIGLPQGTKGTVLARFERGDPAIVEFPMGAGRLVVWASGWHQRDSQWALSSRCVPFLSGCLDYAGGGRRSLVVGVPGEALTLSPETQRARRSDGLVVMVQGGRALFEEPGIYVMEPQGGTVVINVARDERLFESISTEHLQALGLPLADQLKAVSKSNAAGLERTNIGVPIVNDVSVASDLESRQGWWRILLGLVVGLMGIETVWSSRLSAFRREGM